jgi:hypothetical protein
MRTELEGPATCGSVTAPDHERRADRQVVSLPRPGRRRCFGSGRCLLKISRVVLTTADRELVRRISSSTWSVWRERLVTQRRSLAEMERILTDGERTDVGEISNEAG